VFGLSVANTHVSHDLRQVARRDGEGIAPSETLLEVYYNLKLSGWLNVSPHYQAIWNAAGDPGRSTSVFGIRVQLSF